MADADFTRPVDDPQPLDAPPREQVKLLNQEAVQDTEEAESPSDEIFTSTSRRLTLDEEERTALSHQLDRILTDIQHAREDGAWDANWDLYEDAYFGVIQERPFGLTNVHVPITQEAVDTVLAVLEQALFAASPWLQVIPREKMDVDTAKRKEEHLQYALETEMCAKERLEPVNFETTVLGTGVGHLPWLRETDRIRDEEVYDGLDTEDMRRFHQRYPHASKDFPQVVRALEAGKKQRITVEYTEARHDGPDLQHIPLRDWIVRPTAKWHALHREVLVGHRFRLRWDDLVRLEDEGYYDDVDPVRFRPNEDGTLTERTEFQTEEFEIVTAIVRWRRPHERRERRYLIDFHRDSRTILRILTYPYWHNRVNYLPFYLQRSTRYIYGLGIGQKIEGSQTEVNASHTLLLDAISYAMPMFMARESVKHTFNPLRDGMYPGKTWYLPNPQTDVQQFQVSLPASINVLSAVEQSATRHGEVSTGATQNLSGLESARDPDAPASKTLQQTQQALMRIGKYLAVYGTSLSELGFQVEELIYQFSPNGKLFRVMGPEGVPAFPRITRQELRLRADYQPQFSTAVLNPDKEKRDNLEALELLLKLPGVAQDQLKLWAAIEIALDSLGSQWGKKKHKFLPSPTEIQNFRATKEIQTHMQSQQIQQAIAQRRGGGQPQGGNGAGLSPSPSAGAPR